MRLSPTNGLLITLLLPKYVAPNHVSIANSTQNNLRVRSLNSESRILCNLISIFYMPLDGAQEIEPTLRCETDDGRSMPVTNISQDFFQKGNFQSGKTQVSVLASSIESRISDLESGSQHDVIDMTARSGEILLYGQGINNIPSSSRLGNFTLAVIRVSDNVGHSPDITQEKLSDDIFGNHSLSLVDGYRECSGNKVNINQANSVGFLNGVMDITISHNISNKLAYDVEKSVTDQLIKQGFNKLDYTNVMYILPAQVRFNNNALGYAWLNGRISVISNTHASRKHVLMHEIGHNFGQHHSGGRDGKTYGDYTGMMGYPKDTAHTCFNAAKSWWFDWYSDRHVEVTPTSTPQFLKMLGIDDYLEGQANSDDQYTVARIVGNNETDLFVMYNRAKVINQQVTIVSQEGDSKPSWLEAGISLDKENDEIYSKWTKINWNGSGKTLVIQICEMVTGAPDYAKIHVYLQGANEISCCSCRSGMSKFKVEVMTDSWGDETGWWLKEQNGASFDKMILRDRYLESNNISTKEVCIDNSKCYKFKIRDEGKDGICCEHGYGWYNITHGENLIKYSTFQDLENEVTLVGAC